MGLELSNPPRPDHTKCESPFRRFFVRRRFVVDREFQVRFTRYILAVFGCCALLMGAVLFGPLFLGVRDTSGADSADSATALLHLHGHFWWALAGCIGITTLASIRLSHRIAGPLVRFKRNLRSLIEGHVPDGFSPRRHDFMATEVALLNELAEATRERVERLRASAEALVTASERLGPSAEAESVTSQARALRDDLERIRVR